MGGSNYGIENDNPPDWHNTNCVSTLQVNVDESAAPVTRLISGTGYDEATGAGFELDYLNHAADQNVKLMSDLFK